MLDSYILAELDIIIIDICCSNQLVCGFFPLNSEVQRGISRSRHSQLGWVVDRRWCNES
jgi:hypothetical protein